MKNSAMSTRRKLTENASPADLCREAIQLMGDAVGQPPLQLEKGVDEAERAVVRLRDWLVEWLREDAPYRASSQMRHALDQANVALSLIVGVEYPATGIHRELIEEAQQVLRDLEKQLPKGQKSISPAQQGNVCNR